jgi:hypothetical protein
LCYFMVMFPVIFFTIFLKQNVLVSAKYKLVYLKV